MDTEFSFEMVRRSRRVTVSTPPSYISDMEQFTWNCELTEDVMREIEIHVWNYKLREYSGEYTLDIADD